MTYRVVWFMRDIIRMLHYLGVPAVPVYKGDNRDDMFLLDHVQGLRTVYQHTMQHVQHTCNQGNVTLENSQKY